jgi:hypothetical protein
MMAVYTGFAIVLTTLIWVYLSWLILLDRRRARVSMCSLVRTIPGLQHASPTQEFYVPGRDPHGIKLADIIETLRRPPHGRAILVGHSIPQAHELIAHIQACIHRDLGDRSLADFIGDV